MRDAVAEYHLLTIWRIEAPLEKVYAAIENSLRWPEWWPSVRKVEQTADGDSAGIDNVRRYAWQGKLPYRVVFDVRATRVEKLVAIEGKAEGDLAGVGRWKFSRQGKLSVVHYEWHVRSNRWWMNLVAPVARSIFTRNHAQIMEQGGRALARLLKAPLVSQENIDLMALADTPGVTRGRLRQRGRIDPALALVAGIGAGVTAMVIQLYGFTALFPLFALARDWVTLTTHIVFGVTLVAGCRLFARSSTTPKANTP